MNKWASNKLPNQSDYQRIIVYIILPKKHLICSIQANSFILLLLIIKMAALNERAHTWMSEMRIFVCLICCIRTGRTGMNVCACFWVDFSRLTWMSSSTLNVHILYVTPFCRLFMPNRTGSHSCHAIIVVCYTHKKRGGENSPLNWLRTSWSTFRATGFCHQEEMNVYIRFEWWNVEVTATIYMDK